MLKTTLQMFFIIVATIGLPTLHAAEALHTVEMDERMFGFRLHENGSGFEATMRHERRDYDFAGELRKTFSMRDAFRTLARSNDGRVLIHNTQSRGLEIVVWDMVRKEIIGKPKTGDPVSDQVSFLTDDGSVAIMKVGSDFHQIEITAFRSVRTHAGPKTEDLWFHGFHHLEGDHLVAVFAFNTNYLGQPGAVVIWDIEQEKEIKRVSCDHSPRNCWFSPDGRWLVVATRHKLDEKPVERTRLYDAANTYKPWDLGEAMIRVSFSRDGERLATLDGTNQIKIWNVQSHEPVSQFKIAKGRILACGIQFSSDSKQICVGYNEDTMRRGLWDWAGRVKVFSIE